MQNWIRYCEILVGNEDTAIDLSMFKCTFKISQSDFKFPKEAVITIYNLSTDTVNRIVNKEFTKVQIIAGYEDNHGLIFNGQIAYYVTGREGTDSYLTIQAVDSELSHNYATVNATLSAGYTQKDRFKMLTKVIDKLGIKTGISDIESNVVMPRGRPELLKHSEAMDNLANQNDSVWFYDNGGVNLVPRDGYIKEYKLDGGTGLIGVPQGTINSGINVRCLINPNITIFTLIKINTVNESLRGSVNFQSMITDTPSTTDSLGEYKVINIFYRGDTRGNDWYMDLICVSKNDPIMPSSRLIAQGL